MHEPFAREISLSDDLRIQRQASYDKLRVNWETIPAIGFAGWVVSVSLFIVAKSCWELDVGIYITMIVGAALGTALGYASERRRLALMPDAERRWHADFVALYAEIESHNERSAAFWSLVTTFKRGQHADPTLVGKYRCERDSLTDRLRIFRQSLALKRYEEVLERNGNGRFRDTRDVTEQVFVRRVRVAQEESEIDVLLAKDESPNEAQFRELEEQYGEDVPLSKEIRRIS